MPDAATLYGLLGIALAGLGLHAAIVQRDVIRRLLALNVMGAGVFLVLIATAYFGPNQDPDPIPHALVLTGIVVAVAATALALALVRAFERSDDE